MTDASLDEFSFLPAQAAAAGVLPPPVRRRTHTLGDGRVLSALQYGAPGATEFTPPIVTFLHGAGLNAHTWDATVLALGLPALVLDLPGHGDSSWREDAAYTGATIAADVAPAIAAWTRTPQVVVGHSLGGLSAAALAADHPELVTTLVVVDISPGLDPNGGAAQIRAFFAGPTDWASRDELVERALRFGLGGSRESAERGVFLNSRVRDDGRVEWKHHFARLANRLAADPEAAAAADEQHTRLAHSRADQGWDDLARVRAPVILVRGTRGFLTEADRDEVIARGPGIRVVEISAGHNVHEERPADLARLIGDVVRGQRDGV